MAKAAAKLDWRFVIAERSVEWEDGPDGGAVLLVPRFRWGLLRRWLGPRLKRPYLRLSLDETGSFAWHLFDGETTFESISQAMQDRFGSKVEPAKDRLQKFLTILHKNKFVVLLTPVGN